MSTPATSPHDILARLAGLHAECPGCHLDLSAEHDARTRTKLAWVCNNAGCTEANGSWTVTEADIRRASLAPAIL